MSDGYGEAVKVVANLWQLTMQLDQKHRLLFLLQHQFTRYPLTPL
jgi:hypothetical protein